MPKNDALEQLGGLEAAKAGSQTLRNGGWLRTSEWMDALIARVEALQQELAEATSRIHKLSRSEDWKITELKLKLSDHDAKIAELEAELNPLRELADKILRKGHYDTCSHVLVEDGHLNCDCGYEMARATRESQPERERSE